MKRIVLLLTILLLGTQSYAVDIKAIKTNESFEEVARIDRLEQVKINTVPRTTYTPKNLRTQYIMSFQGRRNDNTAVYWSNTFTDYDTKIVKSYMKDGKFYIEDNTGSIYQTGIDYSKAIQTTNNNLQRLNNKVDIMEQAMYKLDDKMNKGLATVSALASLHPNPRHQGKTQVSIGSGVYNTNVAGAIGLFHYVNNNVMVSIGASYGGSNSWAGNVGLSIGF